MNELIALIKANIGELSFLNLQLRAENTLLANKVKELEAKIVELEDGLSDIEEAVDDSQN